MYSNSTIDERWNLQSAQLENLNNLWKHIKLDQRFILVFCVTFESLRSTFYFRTKFRIIVRRNRLMNFFLQTNDWRLFVKREAELLTKLRLTLVFFRVAVVAMHKSCTTNKCETWWHRLQIHNPVIISSTKFDFKVSTLTF